jgi:uncharacterized integral membrane protein
MTDAQSSPTTRPPSPVASATAPKSRRRGLPWARIIIAALCLIYGILFVSFNSQKIRIHFVFVTVTTHLWVGFLLCLVLGALLGQAFGMWRRRSAKSSN